MPLFSQKKILFICNSLVVKAGVESRTLEQMLFFRSKGFECEICVLRQSGPMADLFAQHGFKVVHIPVYTSGLLSVHLLSLIKLLFYVISNRFGVIIGVQPISHYFARLAASPPLGRRLIAMERSEITNRPKEKLFLDYLFSLVTHKIVCVGPHIKDFFIKNTKIAPEKIVVIEDGASLDPPTFSTLPLNKKNENRFVFGNIGMLLPSKRQRILIKAFADVAQKYKNSLLVLVGSGPDELHLKQLCRELSIEDKVVFTGQQLHPHDYYPIFSCFVFPSISEGCGTALYEAMLHKKPVICTDIPPMNGYIVNNRNGLLFEPDNIAALVKKMEKMICNRSFGDKLAGEGYKTAEKYFDYDQQMDKFYKIAIL